MRTVLSALISLLFPKRPSEHLIDALTELNPHPKGVVLGGTTITYMFSYQTPVVRALITEAKFHNHTHALRLLGTSLKSARTNIAATLVSPKPLSPERQRERGYNQIEQILTASSTPYHNRILKRHERPPQMKLNRQDRLQNVADAFYCAANAAEQITGKDIVLIDDVVTTGATMAAARAALARHHPASITCIALAH